MYIRPGCQFYTLCGEFLVVFIMPGRDVKSSEGVEGLRTLDSGVPQKWDSGLQALDSGKKIPKSQGPFVSVDP